MNFKIMLNKWSSNGKVVRTLYEKKCYRLSILWVLVVKLDELPVAQQFTHSLVDMIQPNYIVEHTGRI